MDSVLVSEITRQDLQDLRTPSSHATFISNVNHLSSYNWIEAPTPTIAVPGSPALWNPPTVPRQMRKDSGFVYIAQNAARHPDSPLEPLFRALLISKPSFDLRSVDVVTDRNNIRKLLSFVNPSSSRNGLEPFTISIEIAHNTAIFCREETKTYEIIRPGDFKGYGHEFEKAYTKCQISGSTGHHRIVQYRFGGLSLIVRYETDGFVATSISQPSRSNKTEDDSLSGALASLSLSLSPVTGLPAPALAGSKLAIRKEGKVVPSNSTLEIKTRVSHKRLEIRDIASQLWISQTPKLVRAYHSNGLFQVPWVEDVASSIASWEKENNRHLAKLAALMNRILTLAKELGGTIVMKYDSKGDRLVLSKVPTRRVLPDDLYSNWEDTEVVLGETPTPMTRAQNGKRQKGGSALPSSGLDEIPASSG